MKTWKLNKKPFMAFMGWLILTLLTLDACIGSYGELEPQAGNILLLTTFIFVAIGALLAVKFKPNFIIIEDNK